MTSQFANFIPVQDLPTGVSDVISGTENISESVEVQDADYTPSETMSESVLVTVT